MPMKLSTNINIKVFYCIKFPWKFTFTGACLTKMYSISVKETTWKLGRLFYFFKF